MLERGEQLGDFDLAARIKLERQVTGRSRLQPNARLSGRKPAITPTVPVKVDSTGALCGTANTRYQEISATLPTPAASFKVPAPPPACRRKAL